MNNAEVAEFFATQRVSIHGNAGLREPQIEGYSALQSHFALSSAPCYVQLPVGCGKTGLMGLTPFGNASGRVLILAPNTTIRSNIIRELNVSDRNCFYNRRGVFVPTRGPFVSELKPGANFHDCDEAHIVVANIQQFAGKNNRWYEKFPADYFRMILVDEGHHGVAETWQRLFDYFVGARVVSYTATPMRSDGRVVEGKRVYSFSYARSMLNGLISPITSISVKPDTLEFTAEGVHRRLTLEQVLEMRERDWFSKGIALSPECNEHIVVASLDQLDEVRKYGSPRQLIAVACSVRHAEQVASLYRQHSLKTEVIHSNLPPERKAEIEAGLRSGMIEVIVQVNMLGEGYDLGTLSVAAVFRPYRSLTPYIQFIGRILRLAEPSNPFSRGNHVYVVSHVGMNDERWWTDFQNFDSEDRDFFQEMFDEETELGEGNGQPRRSLRPFMRVLNETVNAYIQRGFLPFADESLLREVVQTLESRGFNPLEFGLTEENLRRRLELAAQADRELPATTRLVQPQHKREALQIQLSKESRSIADAVVNRLDLSHGGRDLVRHYPGRGDNNLTILVALASAGQNAAMGVEKGGRKDASIEQFQKAINKSPDLVDSISASVRRKVKESSGTS